IKIINNRFIANNYYLDGLGSLNANALSIGSSNNVNSIKIINNIFKDNSGGLYNVHINAYGTTQNTVIYQNNTHYETEPAYECYQSVFLKNQNVSFKNNLFHKPIAAYGSNNTSTIKNCWFLNSYQAYPSTFTASNIYYGDPKINTTTLEPLWSASDKSGLIDMGVSDTDGDGISWHTDTDDQDSDGTRKDIGAVPAHLHGAFTHTLSSQSATDRFNWICLPYLDKLYTNTSLYDADQLGYLLQDYHENYLLTISPSNILESFGWNYNNSPGSIYWQTNSFYGLPREADSRHGYKVKLADGVATKQLEVSGFLCGTYGNTNETMTVNAAPANSYREIWVGYFKAQSEDPLYALSDIANQLIEIKTKRWSMSRSSVNSTWSYSTRSPKFNFGEAV
ncbi:MAG TPA: hypothetical protein PK816_17770, partial [Candidatus Cloacimonadota bacterium]|nr:hypothetical protein [Candidatus Cloacimonadota bacterium]